jgi:hypothetical protein
MVEAVAELQDRLDLASRMSLAPTRASVDLRTRAAFYAA